MELVNNVNKTDKTVYPNSVSLPNYSLVCNASTSGYFYTN